MWVRSSTASTLAKLDGEAQFLVVDGSKKGLPVAMWEHETGEFEKVAPTLAKFAAGLKRK